jgi:hypothetical protein
MSVTEHRWMPAARNALRPLPVSRRLRTVGQTAWCLTEFLVAPLRRFVPPLVSGVRSRRRIHH